MACAWASPRPSAALAAPRGTLQSRKAASCIVRAPAPSGRPQLLQQGGARQRLTRPAAWGRNARDWAPPPRDQLGWDASDDDYDTDEDLDLFPEEMSNDPEFVAENLLALVLIALAVVASANIALKLLIVTYSLAAAGLRYTVVGILLAILLTQVQPGRWWF